MIYVYCDNGYHVIQFSDEQCFSISICCYIIWRASLDDSPGPFVVLLDLDHAANKVEEPVRSGPEAVAPGSTSNGQVSIVAICV